MGMWEGDVGMWKGTWEREIWDGGGDMGKGDMRMGGGGHGKGGYGDGGGGHGEEEYEDGGHEGWQMGKAPKLD